VGDEKVDSSQLRLEDRVYYPAFAEEHFLTFVTPDDRLSGYLRLSLPLRRPGSPQVENLLTDLEEAALIREVHVFGQALAVGEEQTGASQHIGLGTRLLQKAGEIARQNGYQRLAVIAAVGTRRYYEGRGFRRGELYMLREVE
jgi:elongator complex protein 3